MEKVNKKISICSICVMISFLLYQSKLFAREEYIPKTIINLKWHKVKERIICTEWDPITGWISCGQEVIGRFGKEPVSFGFLAYNTEFTRHIIPRLLTTDKKDNLYILDAPNLRILKFNKDGKYLKTVSLEKGKSKKNFLTRCEITDGVYLDEANRIYVDLEGYIYINARDAHLKYLNLKFSPEGEFIGKSYIEKDKEGEGQFSYEIQNSKKASVRWITDGKKEIIVNLDDKLAKNGYKITDLEVFKVDKEGNLYIKIFAEELQSEKEVEQIYKYDKNGTLLYTFKEKENPEGTQTIVTDNEIVYELITEGRKSTGKKEKKIYKGLNRFNERLKDIEGIEHFGDKKITLNLLEGGINSYEAIKVIKWEKKGK